MIENGAAVVFRDRGWNARVAARLAVLPAVAVAAVGALLLAAVRRPDHGTDPAAVGVLVVAVIVFLGVWARGIGSSASVAGDAVRVRNPLRAKVVPRAAVDGVAVRTLYQGTGCAVLRYRAGGRQRRLTLVAVPAGRVDELRAALGL